MASEDKRRLCSLFFWQRPYHIEYTSSRLIAEVKQCRAWSVLGWETAWEHWVLLAFILAFIFSLLLFCCCSLASSSSSLYKRCGGALKKYHLSDFNYLFSKLLTSHVNYILSKLIFPFFQMHLQCFFTLSKLILHFFKCTSNVSFEKLKKK